VLPPDINESRTHFTVAGDAIRFGLAGVKGVGEGAVRELLDARESGGRFTDLFDLARRIDGRHVNRKVFEALVKCGACDGLGANRAQLLDALDSALEVAARATRDREFGQASLFGQAAADDEVLRPQIRDLPAPPVKQLLAWEKETLGIFVSGHPLADAAAELARSGATPIRELRELPDDDFVTVGGMLTAVRRTLTKAQQQMLIATLEDTTGSVDAIVFPKSYPQLQAAFVPDAFVIIKGRVRTRERRGAVPGDEPPLETTVAVNEVAPLKRSPQPPPPAWHVVVERRDQVDALARLLDALPGPVPIILHAGSSEMRMPLGISPGVHVRSELEAIFSRSGVRGGPAA
jgi:DNA polymerase-3 subunit alpha